MSSSDARRPGARLPLSSITREVPADQLARLVDATRPHDEADTAAMGGDEMDRLLAPERAATPVVAPAPAKVIAHSPAPIPPQPSGARIAVAPTHVPIAPVPSRLSEPTVVLTQDAFPSAPAAPVAPPLAPSFGLGPSTTLPFGVVMTPPQTAPAPVDAAPRSAPTSTRADVPVWAQTQLAPSRQKVRAARNTKLYVIVAALSLLAGSIGAAVVMLRDKPSGQGGVPSDASGEPSGRAAVPSGTESVPARTGGVPARTGDPRTRTEDVPARTSESPARTSHPIAPPGTPEFEAKEALTRLREGLTPCVRDVIHTLPGTSPAVPEKLAALRGGAYKSAARDFRSPVFSCLKYRETKPQRFQIQWQVTMQPSEGRGVAWLDDDGDGKADRALSFRAVLVRKNEVEIGEIGFVSPVPEVMLLRP